MEPVSFTMVTTTTNAVRLALATAACCDHRGKGEREVIYSVHVYPTRWGNVCGSTEPVSPVVTEGRSTILPCTWGCYRRLVVLLTGGNQRDAEGVRAVSRTETWFGPTLSADQHVDLVVRFTNDEIMDILFREAAKRGDGDKWYKGHTHFRFNAEEGRVSAMISLWETDAPDVKEPADE